MSRLRRITRSHRLIHRSEYQPHRSTINGIPDQWQDYGPMMHLVQEIQGYGMFRL